MPVDENMKEEFKTPLEFEDSGKFPLPAENAEVYIPFFFFMMSYPLGPLLFKMGM